MVRDFRCTPWRMPKYAGVAEDGQSMWYVTDEQGNTTTTTTYNDATDYNCGNPTPISMEVLVPV